MIAYPCEQTYWLVTCGGALIRRRKPCPAEITVAVEPMIMDPIILSEEEEEDPSTPFPFPVHSKAHQTELKPSQNSTIFVLDDDHSPQKHISMPLSLQRLQCLCCWTPMSQSWNVQDRILIPLGFPLPTLNPLVC